MAPSSTIENCFIFGCADQLRWISWTAYRTVELSRTFTDLSLGTSEREAWEQDAAWQGFRSLMERVLVTWDWAEQFVALHLVARPAIDAALHSLARTAQDAGDTLLALLLRAQLDDSARADRFASSLLSFAFDDPESGEANLAHVAQLLDKWGAAGDAALAAYLGAFGAESAQGRHSDSDPMSAYHARREALLGGR
jgi:toluene monooxygenase system protein E